MLVGTDLESLRKIARENPIQLIEPPPLSSMGAAFPRRRHEPEGKPPIRVLNPDPQSSLTPLAEEGSPTT